MARIEMVGACLIGARIGRTAAVYRHGRDKPDKPGDDEKRGPSYLANSLS